VKASKWYEVLPKREQNTVALNLAVYPDATSFDVSQMPGRCFVGNDHILNTIACGAKVWVVDENINRFMLGRELMCAHGFPYEMLDAELLAKAGITDRNLTEIAGDSFAGNVFLVVFLAALTNFPHAYYKPGPSITESAEIERRATKATEAFLTDMVMDEMIEEEAEEV